MQLVVLKKYISETQQQRLFPEIMTWFTQDNQQTLLCSVFWITQANCTEGSLQHVV